MKFKKVIMAMLALSMAIVPLSGCGGEKQKSADGKVQITVANWPDEDADPKGYERMMNVKKDFEAKYPDIEVTGENYDYEISSFMARAEGGTLPTLYTTFFTEAKRIIGLKYAADLTDCVKEYGYYDKINETFMSDISSGGSIYLLPNSAYSLGIVINKKLFSEAGLVNADGTVKAPKTFDELADMAQQVTEKTGKAGFDALDKETGLRYQVKSRWRHPKNNNRQLNVIRDYDKKPFDYVVAVIFGVDFDVEEAYLIPHEIIGKYFPYNKHQNGIVITLTKGFLSDPQIKDIKEKLM